MVLIPDLLLSEEVASRYALTLHPEPNEPSFEQLNSIAIQAGSSDIERCCVSGLWLLHNFLDRSHELSQDIHTTEGSWLHAIMHRTEGVFSNSKYWYRRAGEHVAFRSVGESFDPFDFVDQCESEYRKGALTEMTQQLAFAEWKALFDYCQANV